MIATNLTHTHTLASSLCHRHRNSKQCVDWEIIIISRTTNIYIAPERFTSSSKELSDLVFTIAFRCKYLQLRKLRLIEITELLGV